MPSDPKMGVRFANCTYCFKDLGRFSLQIISAQPGGYLWLLPQRGERYEGDCDQCLNHGGVDDTADDRPPVMIINFVSQPTARQLWQNPGDTIV